jgi:hypothetical protein
MALTHHFALIGNRFTREIIPGLQYLGAFFAAPPLETPQKTGLSAPIPQHQPGPLAGFPLLSLARKNEQCGRVFSPELLETTSWRPGTFRGIKEKVPLLLLYRRNGTLAGFQLTPVETPQTRSWGCHIAVLRLSHYHRLEAEYLKS